MRVILSAVMLFVAGWAGFAIADATHAERYHQAKTALRSEASSSVNTQPRRSTQRSQVAAVNVESAESSEEDAPLIQITAPDLSLVYHNNEVAADAKFKGKILEVRGQVREIGKNFAGTAYLNLQTLSQFESVDAYLQKDSVSYAAGLSPGDVVTVLCRGDGMIVGSPMLRDCSIK